MILGSGLAELHGKIFRVGHMGPVQSNLEQLKIAMNILEQVLKVLKARK